MITGFSRVLGVDLAPLSRAGMQSAEFVYVGESTAPSPNAVHDQLGQLMVALLPLEYEMIDFFTKQPVTFWPDKSVVVGEQQTSPGDSREWVKVPWL